MQHLTALHGTQLEVAMYYITIIIIIICNYNVYDVYM